MRHSGSTSPAVRPPRAATRAPLLSHTPRALEKELDMGARFIGWFDTHVKGEGETTTEAPRASGEGERP